MPGGGISPEDQTVRIAGTVVSLSADAFGAPLAQEPVDLVISARRFLLRTSSAGRGLWPRGWQYLAVSRSVVFHAVTSEQLSVPHTVKTIEANDIWISFLRAKQISF